MSSQKFLSSSITSKLIEQLFSERFCKEYPNESFQVQFNVYCVDRNNFGGSVIETSATTLVTVNIIDQNDNEPALTETFFSVATRYDTEYRSYLMTLSATDLDSGEC